MCYLCITSNSKILYDDETSFLVPSRYADLWIGTGQFCD